MLSVALMETLEVIQSNLTIKNAVFYAKKKDYDDFTLGCDEACEGDCFGSCTGDCSGSCADGCHSSGF